MGTPDPAAMATHAAPEHQDQSAAEATLDKGRTVGRYVVLDRLGMGGMGVVHAAYDPELDRRVAIKVLLPHMSGRGSEGRNRLLREAQAMAKLGHPNVVAVHDVGTVDGRVWVAMEYVAGQTLRGWLDAEPRHWREVVDMFAQAGQGLAAAHAQGLVHRDFKPDNVMVDDEGRARVMDFGLARVGNDGRFEAEPAVDTGSGSVFDSELTRTGAMVGTPAYMAPEQFLREPADARTDQFSFCVALWEALYGKRPFTGSSLAELATTVTEGTIDPPPAKTHVPAWVRRALTRGLAPNPAQRWPAISALLAVLRADPRRRRRRIALVGGLGLVAAGAFGWQHLQTRQRTAACDEAAAEIDEVWNDAQRAAIARAFAATGLSFADSTLPRVSARLDAWTHEWATVRRETCLSDELPASHAELVEACLQQRKVALEVFVDDLAATTSERMSGHIDGASALPRVSRCTDEALLQRRAFEWPDDGPELWRQVFLADLLRAQSEPEASLKIAERALRRTREVGAPSIEAEALHVVGAAEAQLGRLDAAEKHYAESYYVSSRLGEPDLAQAAALTLMEHYGRLRLDRERASHWASLAEIAADEIGDDNSSRARLEDQRGAWLRADGDFERSIAAYERSLEIRLRTLGPDHPYVAVSRSGMALTLQQAGRLDESDAEHRRAVALLERLFGSDHPQTLRARVNHAEVASARGDPAAAETELRAVLPLLTEALGEDDLIIGVVHNNLAGTLKEQGKHAEALREYEHTLEILLGVVDDGHPYVRATRANLAEVLGALGRPDEAAKYAEPKTE